VIEQQPSAADAVKEYGQVLGQLAESGIALDPNMRMHKITGPTNGRHPVVLLDRVADIDGEPDFCVHGYVACYRCQQLCYLGDRSYEAVCSGGVIPICLPCAHEQLPADGERVGRINDTRKNRPH
jgi:hypothetical protein